ncbi:putative tail tip protein [Erwinia phage Gungnir39]|nr:putative tail tip protein [Erwinia phage Gungnir39]
MADIYYPHDYLPMPLQDGYAFSPVSPLVRSTKVNGRGQQRRAYTSTPTMVSVTWFMTAPESVAFESWVRDKISDGAAWFYMKLQVPTGLSELVKCRFSDFYVGPLLVPPNNWRFTATLELEKRPIAAPGWGEFPEYLIDADIIDLAINREWPRP